MQTGSTFRNLISAAIFVSLTNAPLLFGGGEARSESLKQALGLAYTNNPQIEAERATLRATDEGVAQALSGYRPTITSQLSASSRNADTSPAAGTDGRSNPRSFNIELVQPLFRGLRTRNAVNEAEANVRAGQQSLRNVEQTVLVDAVTAYVNVVRDDAILGLRRANLRFLNSELSATIERFRAGEVTQTDVAQARAQRANAQSAIDLALANLNASRALYRRVVGRAPGRLQQPREPRAKLPRSLRGAIATGLQNNPTVVQALYLEQAARFNVDEIFGELLPSAQLEASYTSTRDPNAAVNRSTEGIVTGRVTIPLYQGGEPRARLRQAKHTHVSRLQAIEDARTRVREQVVTAWSLLLASRAQLVSGQAQVAANQTALSGVREEERVGQRTLLDVLDAQQALLDSRVTLISTQRDIIVNAYTLLAAMGQFDGATYGVASVVYDPDAHYHEARRKWLSVTITERPPRHGGAKDGDYAHHRPLKLGGAREKTSNARPVDGLKQGSWGGWQTMTSPKPQGAK